MDASFYEGLAAELDAQLRGREIRGVEDPRIGGRTPEGMLLRFAELAGGLMISLNRDCAAVFWTRAISGTRSIRGVLQRLLPRIQGAVVRSVRQPAPDRVLALDLDGPEGGRTLWLEMTGRLANLALTDESGIILVVARAVNARMSRVRQLEVGEPYTPPPLPKSWRPSRETADGIAVPDVALRQAQGERDLALRLFVPSAANAPKGQAQGERDGEAQGEREHQGYSETAERAYLAREEALAIGRKRGELMSRLRAKLVKRGRLVQRLAAELEESKKDQSAREIADHLAAHLHNVRRGQTSLQVVRFDGSGTLDISLDPTRSAAENLEHLFKRARKAERSLQVVGRRIEEIRSELASLQEWLETAESADRWETLVALEEKVPADEPDHDAITEMGLPPGVGAYFSSDGLAILVGRTAKGNQSVTFQLARPRDLWFHARDYPGSHVVLRRAGKKEPPPRSVLEAAAIAAHFSKAQGQIVVDVACAMRYQVRAPRGAAAGQVQYSGEKTIAVRMEPKLLAPLHGRQSGAETS